MASGLNMKVLLQLQAKEFNKGIGQVKKSLNGLRNTFKNVAGVLVGGFGLGKAVSAIKDTAVQLSVAEATLKNVSKQAGEYGENLQFLQRISNQYGQNLIALTGSFAQFRAAADTCNMSLDDMRKIYESLTRAAGAYHLSADQSNNAMLAVTQMMSKGKVASEELRRQLGNSLPGAFNIMTAAAYSAGAITENTTAAMEDAMKKGQVAADKVLPAFAEMLNQVTANANFDSLQSSLNRLSNSWTNLVKNTNAEGMYKNMVDGAANTFDHIGNNLNKIKNIAIGIFAGILSYNVFGKLGAAFKSFYTQSVAYVDGLNASVRKTEAEIVKLKTKLAQSSGGRTGIVANGTATPIFLDPSPENLLRFTEDELKIISQINHKWMEVQQTNGKIIKLNKYQKQNLKDIHTITEVIDHELKLEAEYNATIYENLNGMEKMWVKIKNNIGAAVKAYLPLLAISAVVGVVTTLVKRLEDAEKEVERIKDIYSEFEKKSSLVTNKSVENATSLRELAKIATDTTKTVLERLTALKQINSTMGKTANNALTLKSTYEEINNEVNKWCQLTVKQSELQFHSTQKAEAEQKKYNVQAAKLAAEKRLRDKGKVWQDGYGREHNELTVVDEVFNTKDYQDYTFIKNAKDEIEQYNKIISQCDSKINELTNDVNKLMTKLDGDGGGGDGTTKNLKKEIDDYKDKLKELENQKKRGAISEEEYQKELLKTTQNTWKTIAGFDNLEAKAKALGSQYVDTVETIKSKLQQLVLDDTIKKIALKAIEDIDKELAEAEERTKEANENIAKELKNGVPKKGTRETFFDYKKSDLEKLKEAYDLSQDYVDALQSKIDALMEHYEDADIVERMWVDDLIEALNKAQKEANTLKEKTELQEWVEDVKDLKKAYDEVSYSSFKNMANSIDRLASGAHNLAEAFATLAGDELSEEFSEFFNKIDAGLSIMNEMIQLFETFNTVIKGLQATEEAYGEFKKTLSEQERIDAAVKAGLLKDEQAEELKSMVTTVSAETTKQGEIGATTTELAGEAVAGAASSQASIPYIGPILAAAAVAGIVGLLAANMSKFAKGGLVSGNSTQGDNNFVRANSGEMILTKGQQGTLFEAIKSGNLGGNGGEWRVRGTDLIKVINNTQRKIKG